MRAAVDIDLFAGNVGGFPGCQEYDGVGDFLGFTGTAHGDAVDDSLCLLGRHTLPDLRVDQAGTDAVCGDPILGYLTGQILGEAQNRCLGCRIVRAAENTAAPLTGDRA